MNENMLNVSIPCSVERTNHMINQEQNSHNEIQWKPMSSSLGRVHPIIAKPNALLETVMQSSTNHRHYSRQFILFMQHLISSAETGLENNDLFLKKEFEDEKIEHLIHVTKADMVNDILNKVNKLNKTSIKKNEIGEIRLRTAEEKAESEAKSRAFLLPLDKKILQGINDYLQYRLNKMNTMRQHFFH